MAILCYFLGGIKLNLKQRWALEKKSDLRDFLVRELGKAAFSAMDRARPEGGNFIEEFVIQTTEQVSDETILALLRKYYPNDKVIERGSFHWIVRSEVSDLLVDITNFSESGGAHYFGGDRKYGGIGVRITEHAKH